MVWATQKGVELTPVSVNVTLFINKVFADDNVKMRSAVRALIQYDCCPHKKRQFGHRNRNAHRYNKYQVKVGVCFPSQETTRNFGEGLGADLSHSHQEYALLSPRFQTFSLQTCETVNSATQLVVLCNGSSGKLMQEGKKHL